jgi:hypothetical protein
MLLVDSFAAQSSYEFDYLLFILEDLEIFAFVQQIIMIFDVNAMRLLTIEKIFGLVAIQSQEHNLASQKRHSFCNFTNFTFNVFNDILRSKLHSSQLL